MARGSVPVWLSIVALARREKAAVAVRHAVRACAQAARAGAALSLSSDRGLAEPVLPPTPAAMSWKSCRQLSGRARLSRH